MKLDTCLEFAYNCGLSTVGEAYCNISQHAMSLFPYDDIHAEITELFDDIEEQEVRFNDLVLDLIPIEKQKEIDKEMDEFFDKQESLPEIDVDCLFADGGIIAITPTHLFGE